MLFYICFTSTFTVYCDFAAKIGNIIGIAKEIHNKLRFSTKNTDTYRLSEGVARNQNATYLLKNILKISMGI